MYHHLVDTDGKDLNNWTTTADQFRKDLMWLADNGYEYVLPSALAAGQALPQKAVMLTFDDGYASNYTLAYPLLQEFHAKAVISLITHYVQEGNPGFLSWDMCREMARSGLVEFGSHTHNAHNEKTSGVKRLAGESRAAYESRVFPDIQTSIDLIQAQLGVAPLFFAYPHGQTDSWARDFIQEHFALSVTTKHGPANITKGLFRMPRHNITTHGVEEYLE
jgi:biofilm PGA synthesis lipoprotein PgaB